MNVTALGAGIASLAAGVRGISPSPGASAAKIDRGDRRPLRAADHHPIAALDAPDTAGSPAVDVANALLGQLLGATDVVLVEGVAAINDDVARFQQAAER